MFSVLAEWQALLPTTRRTVRVVFFPCRNFLKYAAHWGAHGNACCCDYTDDLGEELVAVCRRIIRVEGKRSRHSGCVTGRSPSRFLRRGMSFPKLDDRVISLPDVAMPISEARTALKKRG